MILLLSMIISVFALVHTVTVHLKRSHAERVKHKNRLPGFYLAKLV